MTTTVSSEELLEQVLRAIVQVRPGAQPEDTFSALGLDSLDRLALVVAVERITGLSAPDHVLVAASSGADLTRRLLTVDAGAPAPRQPRPLRAPAPVVAVPGDGPMVGEGTRLWADARVADGARVGAGCTLGQGVYVGTGAAVGDLVKLGNNAGVFGATVADGAMICPGALLLEDSAPRATTPDGRRQSPADWTHHPVTVQEGATVGAGAVVTPGVTVGPHAMVGAGAVVLRDVPAHALVLGNPARQVGWVCRCGRRLNEALACPACSRTYRPDSDHLTEATGDDVG